jgi:hypothetical protein
MTLIRELLDLPDQIRPTDFVLSLNAGIQHAEATVSSYAVTPNLVQSFRQTLSIISSALRTKRSEAAYIHGSFGSGKSHFMAVLNLMLQGHKAAWARPELHPLRQEFDWVGQANLLQLPLHMIGADSLEQKIFDAYVRITRELHPRSPVPPLYLDQELFENAAQTRARVGDSKFFDVLNTVASDPASDPASDQPTEQDDGWGDMAAGEQWDAPRFEAAIASADDTERARLFSALNASWFTSFSAQGEYVSLDKGLGIISRHAAALGYDAVILHLDELILWLAGHFSRMDFVQNEIQKMAKFKEAEDEQRHIPLVTFIARQRDLAELVGEHAVGAEQSLLRDSLSWIRGRFEPVKLDERNLPAIVEKRVLQPKDDSTREILTDSFAKTRKTLESAFSTLLGSQGTEDDFRQVYPFSPALVETLVALSDCLQRERTAIRILMELLVEHLPDLEAGQVVPLGDVFDVIAGGDQAFDSVMQDRFDRAKHLYRNHLLPLIQAESQTDTKDRCQRLRDDHPVRLGCSRCPETACRNDNRLAKTLLVAALVPEVKMFKDLTIRDLVHLNHGVVDTPFPGTEVQMAADKVRRWATQIGQLRIGAAGNPTVSLRLEGVDLSPVLASAQGGDSPGARKSLLKRILFGALELPAEGGAVVNRDFTWRGTRRPGQVRFGNVRELADSALTCAPAAEWYVVIDYPFDEQGHGPADDLKRLERFKEAQGGADNYTLVWLPTFFSDKLEQELGRLAIIEHILTGDSRQKYLGHLRPEDQSRARLDLESLGNQKRAQIQRAIMQAYGIAAVGSDGLLDPSRKVEEHHVSLQPGLEARPLLAGSFKDGMDQLAERLLEQRHPHHPRFLSNVTPAKLERVRVAMEEILESAQRQIDPNKDQQRDLRDFAEPLGLVQGQSTKQLDETRLRDVEQQRVRAGKDTPTVGEVRAYVDPFGNLGLTPEASDLMVSVYCTWSGRTFQRMAQPYDPPKPGKLPDDVELVRPELPTNVEWQTAMERVGHLFGITWSGRALTPRNLTTLSSELNKALKRHTAACSLPGALTTRLSAWASLEPPPPRLVTARCGATLVAGLEGVSAAQQVRLLAGFDPQTSVEALGRSLSTSRAVLDELEERAIWITFQSVAGLVGDPQRGHRATEILELLREALSSDQLNLPLEKTLDALTRKAGELIQRPLQPVPPVPPAGWVQVSQKTLELRATELESTLTTLAGQLEQELGEARDSDELKLELTLLKRKGNP